MSVEETSRDSSKLAKILKKKNEEISQLQDKLRAMENVQAKVIYSCNKCLRKFTKAEALDDHLRVEHMSEESRSTPPVDNNLINAIKLELEVKQLKERLNLAEKELQNQRLKPQPERLENQRCISHTVDKSIETHQFHDASVQTDSECDYTEPMTKSIKENVPEIKEQASPSFSPPTVIDVPESNYLQRLDDALQEQMKLIETWRQNDRNMYREEINGLQKSLKEVLSSMEVAKQKPIEVRPSENVTMVQPRTVKKQQKVHEQDSKEISPSPWEEKFHKLEKLFIEKQDEMQKNLQSLNTAYNEKLCTLEQQLKEKAVPQPTIREVQPFHSTPYESLEALTTSKQMNMYNETESENDHDSEEEEEEQVLKSFERNNSFKMKKRGSRGGGSLKSSKPTFKAMKESKSIKSKAKSSIPHHESSVQKTCKEKKTTTQNFLIHFKERLLGFGIRDTDKGLSTKNMLRIKSQLATDRLKAKKEHKMFSSLRAKLNSKANKLAKQRVDEKKTQLTVTSPEDDAMQWRHKLADKIEEETESDDTSLSTDLTSPVVKKIETKAEIYSTNYGQPLKVANQRMSYPNLDSFNLQKSKNVSSCGTGDEASGSSGGVARFDAALRKILESPIRRPSLPANFQSRTNGNGQGGVEIKPRKVSLKRVIFNDDLTKVSSDHVPLQTKSNNFEVSIESLNDSDEIQEVK